MNIKDIVYVGAFLTDDSHLLALKWAEQNLPNGLFEVEYCHHLTLAHRPDETTLDKLVGKLGKDIFVKVYGISENRDIGAQAFICSLPEGVYCSNERPHITIACRDGVGAVKSNEVLASEESCGTLWSEPLDLEAQVGLYTHKGIKWEI